MNLRIFGASALGALLLLSLAFTPEVRAASQNETLVSPRSALLSPAGGRLGVEQQVKLARKNGQTSLEFVVPAQASNLSLSVPGHTIARWSSTPILLEPFSDQASRRRAMENEKENLLARIATIKSQLAVWGAQTQPASAQELSRRQELMAEAMPALVKEQSELETRLKLLDRELDHFPGLNGLGQLITVFLFDAPAHLAECKVEYSYDLADCGWNAIYDFNARPDNGDGEMVDVRLLAEVWQFTGMDWTDTEITLATLGAGTRAPAPLPSWVVGEPVRPQPRVLKSNARDAHTESAVALTADSAIAPPRLPVSGNPNTVYATWTLASKGLPEGKSRIQIIADAWKAPLQWLARPTSGDNRVWLMAKYKLPPNQAWPDGIAQYSVNGQSIGDGGFQSKGGEATLYFGADPRVSVHTTIDSSHQGETGFINTDKTWTWSWTYTVSNEHNKAIKVRVERPSPMVANENITVTYKDKPQSVKDPKEHMVYWEVDVPAHGKTSIEHSITISSPQKLPLLPDVP